jgi:hypothetical protein
LAQRSREQLRQAPVVLSADQRQTVGSAVRDRLTELGSLVACIAMMSQHGHILAKIPIGNAKKWVGIAKKHAWFVMREHGYKTKLWAGGCKALPIDDRAHQLNVYRYIMRHRRQGAWVWTMVQDK